MSRTEASAPNAFSDLDQYPRCEDSRTSRQVPEVRERAKPNRAARRLRVDQPGFQAQPVQAKSRIGLSVGPGRFGRLRRFVGLSRIGQCILRRRDAEDEDCQNEKCLFHHSPYVGHPTDFESVGGFRTFLDQRRRGEKAQVTYRDPSFLRDSSRSGHNPGLAEL